MKSEMFEKLQELFPKLVEFRREMHMYPELSHNEVETPKKIAAFLTSLGLDVETNVGGRGVVARLTGGKPGKTVALRADFDALPIQDEKEVPYKSKVPGVVHACGHDLHTSALLGVASVLSDFKESLEGTVVFIHQFAEEVIPGGAKFMIDDHCLEGVDVIYGAHVHPSYPVGTIGVTEGNALAAGDTFEIDITGVGGHAGKPHLTVDPLVAGSQVLLNLQQIVSRQTDPVESAVVSVTQFHGGDGFNVIPEKAYIAGTVRTFDAEVRDWIEQSIQKISNSTCEAIGASAECKYVRGYPPVVNHVQETKQIERLATDLFGKEHVLHLPPQMVMEDFAYYIERVPGTFFWAGAAPVDQVSYPLHHAKFDADERVMLAIGKLFISAVLDNFTQ